MRRHPALIPLSHDHHHALVQARRLREAAAATPERRREAARAFVDFFAAETTGHFRDEEELIFPLLAAPGRPPDDLLPRLLLEHARLRALVLRLRRDLEAATADADLLREIGELLDAHVRSEERELFPRIERTVEEADLDALRLPPREPEGRAAGEVVHLGALEGRNGPLWGIAGDDLNATLLAWEAGRGTPEHVNAERDVLVVVLGGRGTVRLGATDHAVASGDAVLVAKGVPRRITAGPGGIRYLTAHLRRPGLTIAPLARGPAGAD
jgi:quercetin dioxygenase-like cupin family protein/hemerythrin-like domain-containing protein